MIQKMREVIKKYRRKGKDMAQPGDKLSFLIVLISPRASGRK